MPDPTSVGLPATPFMYTLDQLSGLLQLPEDEFISKYIWFAGGTVGRFNPRQIKAINIAVNPKTDNAMWRVSQGELIRWCKLLGLKVYSRGRVV